MFWWRSEHPLKRNFGDEISPLIVEAIFGRRCTWSGPPRCEIVAAGSVLELVLDGKGKNRPVVWGTGLMRDEDGQIADRDLDVVAIRGARSRDRLEEGRDRVALGDPGLLADALLTTAPAKRHRLGVLPHFLDAETAEVDWLRHQDGVHVIDATDDPRRVVEQIAQCETLVSSSLHGLIVADSLDVPNAHVRLSDNRFIGGMYKFRDYYSVFRDPARHVVLPAARLLALGVEGTAAHVEERYRRPLDLPQIKDDLVKAFPSL